MKYFDSDGFQIPNDSLKTYKGKIFDSDHFQVSPKNIVFGDSLTDQLALPDTTMPIDATAVEEPESLLAQERLAQNEAMKENVRKARAEVQKKEYPGRNALFPRTTQNVEEDLTPDEFSLRDLGDTFKNAGYMALDLASLPWRAGATGVGAAGTFLGNRFRDDKADYDLLENLGKINGDEYDNAIEGFANDVLRDPLNSLGTPVLKLVKDIPAISGLGKVLTNGGTKAYNATVPKLGNKFAKFANESEWTKNWMPHITAPKKIPTEASIKEWDDYKKLIQDENLDLYKGLGRGRSNKEISTQDMLDKMTKGDGGDISLPQQLEYIKNLENNPPALGEYSKSAFGAVLGAAVKDAAEQAALEAARQGIEPGEYDPSMVAMAGGGSALSSGLGKLMTNAAKKKLAQKLVLKPTDRLRRFKPETDVLLEEGVMPWTGGAEGVVKSVNDKVDDINKRSSAISNYDKKIADQNDATEYVIDFADIPDIAVGRVLMDLKNHKITRVEDADKILDEIDIEKANMFNTGAPTARDAQTIANAWFDRGRVNRNTMGVDPNSPRVRAEEYLWDASRPVLDEIEGKADEAAEYRKWLPLRDALTGKSPSYKSGTNSSLYRGKIGSGLNTLRYSNPAIKGEYLLGDILSNKQLGKTAGKYMADEIVGDDEEVFPQMTEEQYKKYLKKIDEQDKKTKKEKK